MIVRDDENGRGEAERAIALGGLIAFRTDTFYGLGADPFNRQAVARLKELKGRDGGKPILVVISDAEVVERFAQMKTEIFGAVSRRHWPGALTIVMKAALQVPEELTAGSGTIGLRLPDDERVRALVRACGGALTATSANLAGESPARSAPEVSRAFPEGLSLIVDGGEVGVDKPSTVIDLSEGTARLIREGMISRAALAQTLSELGLSLA